MEKAGVQGEAPKHEAAKKEILERIGKGSSTDSR